MRGDEWEDLFDSHNEIILNVLDGTQEQECVGSQSRVCLEGIASLDASETSLQSCANITRVGSNVIFLGETRSSPHEEVAFMEAVTNCDPLPEPPASGADGAFAATIMMWFQNWQRELFDETDLFVKQQQELLEHHKDSIELLLLEQRAALEKAIAKFSRSARFASVGLATAESGTSSASSGATSVGLSVSDVDVTATAPVVTTPNERILSTLHFTCEDRAIRMHLAYQNAAKKLREKSRLTQLHERIGRVSQKESLMRKRIFDCGCHPHVVEGPSFQGVIAGLILLNAVFIGITSDMSVKTSIESHEHQYAGVFADITMPVWAVAVDYIFNASFIAELIFRVIVLESRFFVGPDWRWNLFDTILVVLSVAEMFLVALGFSPSFMRVLRVVRVSRSLRMLRLMRFTYLVRKLRLMTVAIVNCSMMLMWAVVVLIIVTFLFSVVFVSSASQYISDASVGDEYVDGMKTYFGSLFMTMVTLFMAVTGGVDWWDILRLFIEIHSAYGFLFMLFVVITVLAVLNVINAIFVNDAMESTRTDQDLRMQGELEETRLMLERLTAIFEKIVSAGTGFAEIPARLFVEQVEQEEIKMQFALLGLYYTDGFNFFRLLDIDAKKSLGIDQFVMGCLRLKGGALLIDNNILVEDTKTLVLSMGRSHNKAIDAIAHQLRQVHDKLTALERDREKRDRELRPTGRKSVRS